MQGRPPVRPVALTGQAPVVAAGVAVDEAQLNLTGKPSYLNSLTQKLQPNGWDNGWLGGFISNIDEPVASADGSTINTTQHNDLVTLDLDNTVGVTDLHTVLSITMTMRARVDHVDLIPILPTFDGYLEVTLLVGGVNKGTVTVNTTAALQNFSLSNVAWNEDWTEAELNGMQVRVTSRGDDVDGADTLYIDALDVVVEYVPQSPILIIPSAVALDLASTAVVARVDFFEAPTAEALALTGKVATLKREAQALPSADKLALTGTVPVKTVDFLGQTPIDALALTGQAPSFFNSDTKSEAPGAETLSFTGYAPTYPYAANHFASPASVVVRLTPDAPLLPNEVNTPIGPVAADLRLAGKVPVLGQELHVSALPDAETAALAGYAPTLLRGTVRTPSVLALTLNGKVPISSFSGVYAVPAGALALSGYSPVAVFSFTELLITTYAPVITMDHRANPAAAAITLSEQAVIAENGAAYVATGSLALAGYAPTMSFSSFLTPGTPGLISLSVDREVEFIATPTDILIG